MTSSTDNLRIVVSRDFNVSAESVFDAWLDPSAAGRWLFATPEGHMQTVEIDPRVGGRFRFAEQRGDILADHFGEYLEIDRPRRLVFTLSVSEEDPPSRVAVDIRPRDGGCTLTLTHEIDAAWAAYVDQTRAGWTTLLGNLATIVGDAGQS